MTLIDIWSRVLEKNDLLKHFHDCHNTMYGDLYSWPEFQFYIQGKIKVTSNIEEIFDKR